MSDADRLDKTAFRKFDSHAEAEAADRAYYRNLTPIERLRIVTQLVEQHCEGMDESSRRLQRVYRVIERRRR